MPSDVIHLPLARANLIEALDGEDHALLALAEPAIARARTETRRELDPLDAYLSGRAALALLLSDEAPKSAATVRAINLLAAALAALERVIEREGA
jgi:hypothetical protein